MIDYSILPLMAILVSAAFGAVSIAWNSDRRSTRSMGALFLAVSLWALVDLLASMESDPEWARFWMRWTHLGPLLIGPSMLWIVAQMLPHARGRLASEARITACACGAIGVGVGFLPGVIHEMVPTWYGWMPRYGPVSIALIPVEFALPVYAAVQAARFATRRSGLEGDRKRAAGLRISLVLSIGIAVPTEYVLPLLGVPFPRLGALGVAIASALVWLAVLHETEDLMLSPRGVARRILAELRDGVAFVDREGVILSVNARFAEMCGRGSAALTGAALRDLFDAPVDRVVAGVEDREAMMRTAAGHAIPVSLSSSVASGPHGDAIGIVLAVRDRRDIDDLRRQILSSGRLAAIGELAAGIAHEVNNPIAYIRSDLNLLAERAEEVRLAVARSTIGRDQQIVFERTRDRVQRALDRLAHVAQVVVDVREFAHVGGVDQGGSDPETVVESAMRLARMQRDGEVEMRVVRVVGGHPCDSGQELKQVLLVLLRTLAESAEKGASIEAEVRSDGRELGVTLDAGPLVAPADTLLSRFDALAAHVADPDRGELGLSSAAELLEQLGGRLSVEAASESRLRVGVSLPLFAQVGRRSSQRARDAGHPT